MGPAVDRADHTHPRLRAQLNSTKGRPSFQPNKSDASPHSRICGDHGGHDVVGYHLAHGRGRYLGFRLQDSWCLSGLQDCGALLAERHDKLWAHQYQSAGPLAPYGSAGGAEWVAAVRAYDGGSVRRDPESLVRPRRAGTGVGSETISLRLLYVDLLTDPQIVRQTYCCNADEKSLLGILSILRREATR